VGPLTRALCLATLDVSEGAGVGEIDDSTVAGLKATLVRAFSSPHGRPQWAIDMGNSDAG
jgi:hypothetical protein